MCPMHLILGPGKGPPEEQMPHLRIIPDAFCRALHTDTATFHHDAVGRNSKAGTHVLLNQQHGCAGDASAEWFQTPGEASFDPDIDGSSTSTNVG